MLGEGGGGLRRAAHRRRRPAVALCRGGATTAAGRRLGWAWELRWGEVNPFPRSIGAVGGRRWELDGGLGAAAALLRGGGVLVEEARRGRVQELQSGDGELAGGRLGAEGGRRGELRGSRGGGAHGAVLGELGSSARRRLRGNWSSLRETTGMAARQRHGDACWHRRRHRRREAAATRAEQEMEAMAFL